MDRQASPVQLYYYQLRRDLRRVARHEFNDPRPDLWVYLIVDGDIISRRGTTNSERAEGGHLNTAKLRVDLLGDALRGAIDRWVQAGRTESTFDHMVEAFDRWKLAKYEYERDLDRSLDLPFIE